MADVSPPSSPGLRGYTTAGEEANNSSSSTGSSTATTVGHRQRQFPRRGRRRASLPQRDANGRFLPRRDRTQTEGSDQDSPTLDDAASLEWDALDSTIGARRWSAETQHDVEVPDHDLIEERLLSPHPEGRESAASGHFEVDAVGMDNVMEKRDVINRTLLEIEDDILPFRGQKVTRECVVGLVARAAELKRALQDGHLYLTAHDGQWYDANLRTTVTDNRRLMSTVIVELECQKAGLDNDATAARAPAAADAERLAARREFVATKIGKILTQAAELFKEGERFCRDSSTGDEQLYEKAEHHKAIAAKLETAVEEGRLMVVQALDHDLIVQSGILDDAVAKLRGLKHEVDSHMVSSRKQAGVWQEKGRRTAARGDLKAPTFSGAAADKLTVYEFEKEWATYKSAVNYSVEEALKELKIVVQQPARAAVQKMLTEVAVFKYLRAHYGNPVVLLNAREEEVRLWADCKGTDSARREWLIHTKSRLESIVALCEEHNIQKYMHFSCIAGTVQSKLPADMVRDFKKVLVKHLSPAGVLDKELIMGLLIDFIDVKILDCTLGVNLDIVSFLGSAAPDRQEKVGWQNSARDQAGQRRSSNTGTGNQQKYAQHNQSQQQQPKYDGRAANRENPRLCVACGGEHPALYYCGDFISARPADRFEMMKRQKSCGRCLYMSRKFTGKKSEWWPTHERYCKTAFACAEGLCGSKAKDRQLHITICLTHTTENRKREADFIQSLDPSHLPRGVSPGNVSFLHMSAQGFACSSRVPPACQSTGSTIDGDGFEIIPDILEDGLFLMQMLPAENDLSKELLCFYDSGCGSAGLSDRAYDLLSTTTIRPGPTILEVAGAKSILVPYGEEQFRLELDGKKQKATVTGLRMANITAVFPLVQLGEAWEELQNAACTVGGWDSSLTADKAIGGQSVDIILGIKYLKYYPVLCFSLPSGLAVYRAKLRSASGCQAVLGGPHSAWSAAANQTKHMNPRAYFTAEARAWHVEQSWVRINQDKYQKLMHLQDVDDDQHVATAVPLDSGAVGSGCSHCHCHDNEGPGLAMYNVASKERKLWHVEELGTESPYRCVTCRNCAACRNGDVLEAISFKEEAEQALIEQSVELDQCSNILWATLPFISDPVEHLKPNRFIAEKVLKSQLAMFEKNPAMRLDTVKSHQKLVDKGHVIADSEIPAKQKGAMSKIPGEGYFIPWRTVYNEGSISTPCRVVFDASSKTPGGESLNGVLAKGRNRLAKLQHLLIRFRVRSAAVTADISMAYNGTRLRPEHLKFQKYLWKADLKPENQTEVRYVATLIYGVKPSGQQCQVSLERLAHCFVERGECLIGAAALTENTYVDDILSGQDTQGGCRQVAQEVVTILKRGSMAVKAFTYSGSAPCEKVSADGTHVGLAGYLWAPEADIVKLDIGPPRLGKARRGRRPDPVVGDYENALSGCFTKRVLTGLVAAIFDPIGLATPLTAGLKLDLHELCQLKLDWDDAVPRELLTKWALNMEKIQSLQEVTFRRTIIPEDAANLQVELLVASDASQNIGVVAIYGRVLRRDGSYSCQLLAARSKLLSGLTIPKAEMKSAVTAAVMAHVVKVNLADRHAGTVFVTDSTICLFWITQDDRPLQVGVRNAVSEVRRLSDPADWYHVDTDKNVADTGTRAATVADIIPGTAWQDGQPWMRLPKAAMPIKTAAQVTLTAEEKRVAATELRAADMRGHSVNINVKAVQQLYEMSRYLVDPCQYPWTKAVRIMAIVKLFVGKLKEERQRGTVNVVDTENKCRRALSLTDEDLAAAESYFFKKATQEVLKFSRPADYKKCSVEKDGILYFSGRLLNSNAVIAMEEVMFDLKPTTFCRPMVDRNSPVAYSIMMEVHWKHVHHLNATTTYRESLATAFIIRGRELAQEVRDTCTFCRRFKARLLEVEMGKIHETRLAMAPPFTYCQVDLFGPLTASCEHNHRSTVKVWGVVFKDPASGAVFVHAMAKCDTSAFVQAYTRFAARFCHPVKLYPDEGSQLLRACAEMEISWLDVSHTLNAQHQVGVEFSPCPVGGHNFHGQVERSIREVKKLFNTIYRGVKLDILGFETAFAWVSNELNNLPTCLGSRYRGLDNLDLITPNRLIHGRSNKRAMSGPCMVESPSRMLQKSEEIFEAWWRAWYEEKLADFVAKPPKWFRSGPDLKIGDVVIFQKKPAEQQLGSPIWTVGKIVDVKVSGADGHVREVEVEYRNFSEQVWRKTHRAARAVAVLYREEDLEVVQGLNQAAREAEKSVLLKEAYVDRQIAVMREVGKCVGCVQPVLCPKHSHFFTVCPYFCPDLPL